MSSILTNNGAIVALQTLKNINSNLTKTQSEIATGKTISNAKDNAAIWAISKTMETDVSAIKTISTGLNTANATVSTARSAAEDITDSLKEVKNKILTAQSATPSDRQKLQNDITSIKDQITGILKTAQFNGVNLIDGGSTADYEIVSSLDRSGSGVTSSKISVGRQNLSMTGSIAATPGTTAVTDTSLINNGGTDAGTAAVLGNGSTQTINIASVGAGFTFGININDKFTGGAGIVGDPATFSFTASGSDSADGVASKLGNALQSYLATNGVTAYSVAVSGSQVLLTNNSGADLSITSSSATGGTPASGGGLAALDTLSVLTDADASTALIDIESLINTAIDAASALGSSQARIASQNNFVGKMADLMTSGIGSLVDANLEETSARLQALQTQQQLGIQALSIANQAPQSVLSLFRG